MGWQSSHLLIDSPRYLWVLTNRSHKLKYSSWSKWNLSLAALKVVFYAFESLVMMANALPAVPIKGGYPKCWQMSPGLLFQSDAAFLFLLHEEFLGARCSFTVMSSKWVRNCCGTLPVNTDMEHLTGRRTLDVGVLCAFLFPTASCSGCFRSHFRIAL